MTFVNGRIRTGGHSVISGNLLDLDSLKIMGVKTGTEEYATSRLCAGRSI